MAEKNIATYGGQAVYEGVMMRGRKNYALSVRHIDGHINTKMEAIQSPSKLQKVPFIRGILGLVHSFKLGMELINDAFTLSGFEETETTASGLDIWLEKTFGDALMPIIMAISGFLGMLLSVGLFMFLPIFIVSFLPAIPPWAMGILEGLLRMVIFCMYLFFISKNKEISRILAYHGAEHKTIHCYENQLPLTVENVSKQSRLHKRCGTAFLFLFMLISMVVFTVIQVKAVWLRLLLRVLFIPILAGISFEILQWAGKNDGWFVNMLVYPGLLCQKLTTKEPDAQQIEVAIAALEHVLLADKKNGVET